MPRRERKYSERPFSSIWLTRNSLKSTSLKSSLNRLPTPLAWRLITSKHPSTGEERLLPPSRIKVNAVHAGPSPQPESSKVSLPTPMENYQIFPNNNSLTAQVSSMEILDAMEVCPLEPSTTSRKSVLSPNPTIHTYIIHFNQTLLDR